MSVGADLNRIIRARIRQAAPLTLWDFHAPGGYAAPTWLDVISAACQSMMNERDDKILKALLRRPAADVTDAELETVLRFTMPDMHAKVEKRPPV